MMEGFDVAPFDLNRWLICMVGATIAVRSLFVLFKRLGIPCAPNREVLLLVGMGVVMVIFSRHYIYAAAVTVLIVGANFHTRWREWRDETGERRTSDDAP